ICPGEPAGTNLLIGGITRGQVRNGGLNFVQVLVQSVPLCFYFFMGLSFVIIRANWPGIEEPPRVVGGGFHVREPWAEQFPLILDSVKGASERIDELRNLFLSLAARFKHIPYRL